MKKTLMMIVLAGLAAVVSSCGGGGGGGVSTAPGVGPAGPSAPAASDLPYFENAPEANEAVRAMARGVVLDNDVPGEDSLDDDVSTAMAMADTDEAGRAMAGAAEYRTREIPPIGASGSPNYSDYYVANKAFDGNYLTWWAGEVQARRWNLYYGFQTSHYIDKININFYSLDFVPKKVVVLTSDDGITWKIAAKTKRKKFTPEMTINRETRFLWIRMWGNPKAGFPAIRDVAWTPFVEKTGAYAAPGADDNWYFASNAFDGNPDTGWAGQPGAGSWDMYYNFPASRMIGEFMVDMYNINYVTPMTLLISDDGVNWSTVGDIPARPFPPRIFVGKTARYVWLQMRGTPSSGFPAIREITFDFPVGASGGPSEKPGYWKLSNAFDNTPTTLWAGKMDASEWDVFYASSTPLALGTVTVQNYAANYIPPSTELFTSDDGVTWTSAGKFPLGAANQALAVNRTAKMMRFHITGKPAIGYPVIKDITW